MSWIRTKTIRNKILIIFSFTFLVLLIALISMNKIFLKDYYINTNRNNMQKEVLRFIHNYGTEINKNSEYELVKNTGARLYLFTDELLPINLTDAQPKRLPFQIQEGKIIYEKARASGEKGYFEVFGKGELKDQILLYAFIMDDGNLLVVSKAMGLVKEASDMFFNFMLYTSIIIYFVGFIVIYFISESLSRPVIEMKKITHKMANLEFDEKLKVMSKNEIGELMTSINRMADELSNTIQALNDSNENLERELSKERSLEKMRRRFVSDVSHELKNPIGVILAYADGLIQNIPKTQTAKQEYYDIIMDEASRMSHLVKNLLDLSCYESGTFTLEKESVVVNELIDHAIERFHYIADEKTIHIDYDSEVRYEMIVDRLRMSQVIINLLSNAFKHVNEHGTIQITLEKMDERIKLLISNTGILIPDNELELIWNSFYQINTDNKGNGLGLAIVKSIVDLHKGSFRAYTTDQYNCFEIII